MITITRRLARRVRGVFRKALKITRGIGPPICFHASPEGLRIRSQTDEVAVEYSEIGNLPAESLRLPLEFLNDFSAGRDGPVEMEAASDKQVEVRWSEHGVPRTVRYDVPDLHSEFPPRSERMAEQDPRFISALKEASATCDPLATRLAFGCMELSSETGEIAATDAHQLLIQRGFAFPWDDKVLIPANPIWGSSELAAAGSLSVGRTDEAVVVTVGPWSIWLKLVKDARFPNVRDHIPSPESIMTTMELTEEDAQFLADRLPGLPRSDLNRRSVTLDLNGQVLVRGQGENQLPTDLILSNSQIQGTNLRLNTNREFLLRAARLGFRQIHFTGPESPAFCHEEHKTFVWAVLEKGGAILPQANAIRVESPLCQPIPKTPSTQRKTIPSMTRNHKPEKPPDRNGHSSQETSQGGNLETLIEHAESLQETLREATVKFRELMMLLKQHRKESKSVQSVLASLRQLPSLHL